VNPTTLIASGEGEGEGGEGEGEVGGGEGEGGGGEGEGGEAQEHRLARAASGHVLP
jgi:hypothetical protein